MVRPPVHLREKKTTVFQISKAIPRRETPPKQKRRKKKEAVSTSLLYAAVSLISATSYHFFAAH